VNEQVIYDLGFYDGSDTDYYLYKGYCVVAVEADPDLVEQGRRRFEKSILNERMRLIHAAVADFDGESDFFINPASKHHSSLTREFAELSGGKAKKIRVPTITLRRLLEVSGSIAHYIKVDVEGADTLVAKSLLQVPVWKPKFISFEIGRSTYPDIFSALRLAGYSKFQLVNQLNNPSRTGTMYKFNDHSSGFFGEDLPKDKWLPFQEMVSRYVKYTDLRNLDAQELSLGWIDVHATF